MVDENECANSMDLFKKGYINKVTPDSKFVKAWCQRQTVGAFDLLGDAYEDNFFNNACPAGFDLDQNRTHGLVEEETCGRLLINGKAEDVYCHNNFPHCKPSPGNAELFKCYNRDDDRKVIWNSPAVNYSSYYMPEGCAPPVTDSDPASTDREIFNQKKKECLYLLTDIKDWYLNKGETDTESVSCDRADKALRPSSQAEAGFEDQCG